MDSIYAALPASNFTRTLLEHRGAVLQVASVFETLKGINFNSPISPAVDNSENPIVGFRKLSQKQAKRARARGPSIDESPFQRMGVSRPRSQSECIKLTEELLVRQKEILQVCIQFDRICTPLMNCEEFHPQHRTSRSAGVLPFQYSYHDSSKNDNPI